MSPTYGFKTHNSFDTLCETHHQNHHGYDYHDPSQGSETVTTIRRENMLNVKNYGLNKVHFEKVRCSNYLFVKGVQHFQAFAFSCTSSILLCTYAYFFKCFAVF